MSPNAERKMPGNRFDCLRLLRLAADNRSAFLNWHEISVKKFVERQFLINSDNLSDVCITATVTVSTFRHLTGKERPLHW